MYKSIKTLTILVGLFLCLSSGWTQAKKFSYFKNGDRICFLGNSITHGGRYHAFFQTYLATHFPAIKTEFYNCGVSGDVSGGMIRRFKDDVLINQPTHVFLMTGMNDMFGYLYGIEKPDSTVLKARIKSFELYNANMDRLIKLMLDNGIDPILLTPTIYDQTAKIGGENSIGKNDALTQCAAYIRKMAEKHKVSVVDFNRMMNALNVKEQEKDPAFTIIGQDRVHPGDEGHWTMAFEIIKTLYPESLEVSSIEINSKKKSVVKADNSEVAVSKKLKYRVLQHSLPFPFREDLKSTMNLMNPPANFNHEIFKVTHLKKGNYTLKIDDSEIGTFSNQELANGVNLSEFETPQMLQARKVEEWCFEYKKVQEKLRDLCLVEFKDLSKYKGDGSLEDKRIYLEANLEKQLGKSWYPYKKKVIQAYFKNVNKKAEFEKEVEKIREQIYNLNKPQWHNYNLNKVK